MQAFAIIRYGKQNTQGNLRTRRNLAGRTPERRRPFLIEMEQQDAHSIGLTDSQAKEVERRLAKPNRKFFALEEARKRTCTSARMKVVIEEEALDDLDGIHAWIAKDDPTSADSTLDRIFDEIAFGKVSPLGHHGRARDTFEWVMTESSHVIVYESRSRPRRVAVIGVFRLPGNSQTIEVRSSSRSPTPQDLQQQS